MITGLNLNVNKCFIIQEYDTTAIPIKVLYTYVFFWMDLPGQGKRRCS